MLAAEVRMWDRFFDNYVSYPQGRVVFMSTGREFDDGKGRRSLESDDRDFLRASRLPYGRLDLGHPSRKRVKAGQRVSI